MGIKYSQGPSGLNGVHGVGVECRPAGPAIPAPNPGKWGEIGSPAKMLPKENKKKKQIEETTAESQSIVVQDNSNPYNTSPKLSRLQMI